MMRRIAIAYRVELDKALRRRFTYLGFILTILALAAAPLVQRIHADGESDYTFIAFATPATLNLLGLLFLLAYCAGLVSSEVGSGTVRLILVRPVGRTAFVVAKLLLGFTLAAALTAFVGLLNWGIVLAIGDARGISYGGELLFTSNEVLQTYIRGSLLGLAPLFAAVAYAILVSTLTRSTGAAIGAAVAVWFLVDLVKHPLGLAPYLFSSYLEVPWAPFQAQVANAVDPRWMPDAAHCLAASLSAIVAFSAAAVLVFRRRDLHA